MALRRWRTAPALWVEGIQTGDGRLFSEGAMEWDTGMPQPFAWLRDGDQHVDLVEVAPQIGVIDSASISRQTGGVVYAEGWIDDEIPDGAELIRRLEAGSASHGSRQGVSVDPDNWALEVLVQAEDAADEDDAVVLASAVGSGPFPTGAQLRAQFAHLRVPAMAAAAGEGVPPDSVVVFEDAVDMFLFRFTRARLRGATCCAVAAFADALIELAPVAAEVVEAEPVDEGDDDQAVVAALAEVHFNVAHATREVSPRSTPPLEWFHLPEPELGSEGGLDLYGMPLQELIVEQPDGQFGVPLTFVERPEFGLVQVYGNAALWGTCHIGYPGECVTPPDSPAAYAHFHHGLSAAVDNEGRPVFVPTGPLTIGTDHAAARLLAPAARDHYANTGLAFADVRASSGTFGPWVSGVCRPLTDEQLAVCRASSLSGDWRRIDGALEFIAALGVSVPGFPIAREAVVASLLPMLAAAATSPTIGWLDGEIVSMVAAGVVQRCADCAKRRDGGEVGGTVTVRLDEMTSTVLAALASIGDQLDMLERRTRPTRDVAASALLDRIRRA